jgi:hypothetical protein
MATKRPTTDTAAVEYPQPGLIGPADTDDPTVRVTSARPTPTDTDLQTGRTSAATAIGHHREPAAAAALRLADEPRVESFEVVAPGGSIVVVTRNIDTGAHSVEWTERSVFVPADAT